MPRDGVWDVRGKKATLSGRRVDRVAIVVFSVSRLIVRLALLCAGLPKGTS